MSRIAYVNGRYLPLSRASVNVEDRGFQFADGVYEVLYRHAGRLIDEDLHIARLDRSLRELRLAAPMSNAALRVVIEEVARRNRLATGLIYLQITRGTAPRAHAFPRPGTPASLVITMRPALPFPASIEAWAASAITAPDERWARCDIKSVSLLPNVLAKQAAREAGAFEAILYDGDGMVTEGSSTTVFIVDAQGRLRSRALGREILPGCTRAALLDGLDGSIIFNDQPFSLEELRGAREVFLTAATTFVKPVVRLDGAPVGDGTPGPVASRLFATMRQRILRNARA